MAFFFFFIGGLISVVVGIIVGRFLNHLEISYVIQATLLVFIGMLGRSGTAWTLHKLQNIIERKKKP